MIAQLPPIAAAQNPESIQSRLAQVLLLAQLSPPTRAQYPVQLPSSQLVYKHSLPDSHNGYESEQSCPKGTMDGSKQPFA